MTVQVKQKIYYEKNRFFDPDYQAELLMEFKAEEIQKVYAFQQTHPAFTKTPLEELGQLASFLGLKSIKVKDESKRFGLNAFKVLGGIYSMAKYMAQRLQEPIEQLSFEKLKSQEVKEQLGELTFISATDGNHGRGVAWAARELGYKAVIYMPKGSSIERLQAIRNEGAIAEIQDVNYDETVRICANLAEENGWVMVQDTAWEGYEEIPRWITQGYSAMAMEIVEQWGDDTAPTHVFLQAGVGSFAAGIAGYLATAYAKSPPKLFVVEPTKAACYYESFRSEKGKREFVTGDMDTIMAGLACGEPNTRAYNLLSKYATGTFACDDEISALGMRVCGNPLQGDAPIISGESGAVTMGLLYVLLTSPAYAELKKELQLGPNTSVLLISTEGDTDQENYRKVVWEGKHPLEKGIEK